MKTNKFLLQGFILCLSIFAFNACTKQQNETAQISAAPPIENIPVENGRLVFRDMDHATDFMTKVSSLSDSEFEKWEKSISFHSLKSEFRKFKNDTKLYDSKLLDLNEFDFPTFRQSVFNSDGEFVVGNYIIWHHGMFAYYAKDKDEALLKSIKSNPQAAELKIEFTKSKTTAIGQLAERSGWMTINSYYGGQDRQWLYNDFEKSSFALKRRYVQFLRSSYYWFLTSSGWKMRADLFLWTHLESSPNGSVWSADGSSRRIWGNLQGSFNVQGNGATSPNITVNSTFDQIVGGQNDFLIGGALINPIGGAWYYLNGINGTINHQALAAFSNDDLTPQWTSNPNW